MNTEVQVKTKRVAEKVAISVIMASAIALSGVLFSSVIPSSWIGMSGWKVIRSSKTIMCPAPPPECDNTAGQSYASINCYKKGETAKCRCSSIPCEEGVTGQTAECWCEAMASDSGNSQ